MPVAKNKIVKLTGEFHDPDPIDDDARVDSDSFDLDADYQTSNPDLVGGFTCEFVEHSDGSVSMRLFGDAALTIRTAPIESFKKVPEKADGLAELYVSPVVRNPQVDLRSALEWSGRQLSVHAVQEAWNAIYPSERGTGKHSLKVKLAEQLAENEKKDAVIEEMLSRLGFSSMEEFRAAQAG